MQNLAIGAGVVLAIVWAVWFVAQRVKAMPATQQDEHATALDYAVWLGKYAGGDCLLSEIRDLAIGAKYPIPPVRDAK